MSPSRISVMGDRLPALFFELLGPDIEVLEWDDSASSEAVKRVVALITYGHPQVDGPLMDRIPNLRIVSNFGVGVDHIDCDAAKARGVAVGNTPGCVDASTADMTLALMLAAARNVVIGDRFARSPEFTHYDPSQLIGMEVTGSTLGIVGLGRIGQQVARRARAFDMRILYHNRRRDPAAEQDLGATYCSLEELLLESDFVALNCPLTVETTDLIGTREFSLMKPTGILINVARGPVVNHEALFEALTSRRIAAAAIDVTSPEPLPRNHPLLKLDNLIITPHLGTASDRTRRRMMEMTVENLMAGLRHEPLPGRVV